MEKMIVAALSPTIIPGDVEKNLDSVYHGMAAAKTRDVELAVFSEWTLTHVIDQSNYLTAQPVPDGPAAQQVIAFAREFEMIVSVGIEELDPDTGVVYNTHFLAGPQGYIGKHRKTHLMVSEMGCFRAGSALDVFDLGKCTAGINICHENMYPENSRVQTLKGMEVVLSPFGCGGGATRVDQDVWLHDFHMACWRARCFDNGIFMIVSGGNGYFNKHYASYACIIDPWANVIAAIEPEPADPEINLVVAELDPALYISRRTDEDYPIRKRRPELFGKLTETY